MRVLEKLVIGIVGILVAAILTMVGIFIYVDDPLVVADQNGMIDCDQLDEQIKSGHMGYLSYHFPSIFAMSPKYKSLGHYEVSSGYRFSSCREEISRDVERWCSEEITDISRYDFNNPGRYEEALCKSHLDNLLASFNNEKFNTRAGSNSLILLGGSWVSISSIQLGEPIKSFNPNNGLFRLCVVYNRFSHCRYFKNEHSATMEGQRLMNLMLNTPVKPEVYTNPYEGA